MKGKWKRVWLPLVVVLLVLFGIRCVGETILLGGPASYLVEHGWVALLRVLQGVCLVGMILWLWAWRRADKREEVFSERKNWVMRILVILLLLSQAAVLLLTYVVDTGRPAEEVPPLDQGILPLMAQIEEEAPDFSVQQALPQKPEGEEVFQDFVIVENAPFASPFLILRQDGEKDEWYHILYAKPLTQGLAKAYVQEKIWWEENLYHAKYETIEEGRFWMAKPQEENPEQILLFLHDNVVAKVTYCGPKDLLSRAQAWEGAIFPGG